MNKSTTLRNLIIFSTISLAAGWIGAWVNTVVPSPSLQESLGILVFIMFPFLAVFLLRGLGGDGWKDFGLRLNLKGNWGWYLLSLLMYPASILLTLGLGAVFGAVSFDGLRSQGFGALLSAIGLGFAMSLMKNIGEEFAWRGYLTPRFKALGLGDFANHMLTGVIWGLWHIPYWLFMLGPAIIKEYSSLGVTGFVVMGLVGIFPTALVYGELRMKTDSLWPAFLAHNAINALSPQLVMMGFVNLKPNSELFFSPGLDGLLMMAFSWILGIWILRKTK
jgi:membrane protease YdiL (CAAX protease family)